MQINNNTIIAGLPAATIRKLLRNVPESFEATDAAAILGWKTPDRIANLLEQLTVRGYLGSSDGRYKLTGFGHDFLSAKFVNHLLREAAERLIDRVMDTGEVINSMPEVSHSVAEIRVFGSYLSDAPEIDKLGISVRLHPRKQAGASSHRHGKEEILRVLRELDKRIVIRDDSDGS